MELKKEKNKKEIKLYRPFSQEKKGKNKKGFRNNMDIFMIGN